MICNQNKQKNGGYPAGFLPGPAGTRSSDPYSQYGSFTHSSITRFGGLPPRWCLPWEEGRSLLGLFLIVIVLVFCRRFRGFFRCCRPDGLLRVAPVVVPPPAMMRGRSRRSFLRCPEPWPCGVLGCCPVCCCGGACDDSPVFCGCGFSSAITVRLINRGRNHKKHSVLSSALRPREQKSGPFQY